MGLYGTVQREGTTVSDLLHRIEKLRVERIAHLDALNRNTIQARLVVAEAAAAGHGTREIAKRFGVTTRTVYAWLKK